MCLTLSKARRIVQRYTEPTDTPKPTNIYCTALQRDEVQLHQTEEHRHKLPQPGKYHRTLIQPHLWGQIMPNKNYHLENFIFSLWITVYLPYILPGSHYLLQCCRVLFFLLKKFFKIFFTIFCDFCDFILYIWLLSKLLFISCSYSWMYINLCHMSLFIFALLFFLFYLPSLSCPSFSLFLLLFLFSSLPFFPFLTLSFSPCI